MHSAAYWIDKLNLQPHPEGGYFAEVYRAEGVIPSSVLPMGFNGGRNFSTSIYYLLQHPQFSAFHRIGSDELWHFYSGNGLNIFVIHPSGKMEILKLGNNPEQGESFQHVVKAGCWFASVPDKEKTFSLVGCTVSPGFDFRDFELAKRETLIQQFPQHKELVTRLTK